MCVYVCVCMGALTGTSHINMGTMKLLLNEYGIKYAKINNVEAVRMALRMSHLCSEGVIGQIFKT